MQGEPENTGGEGGSQKRRTLGTDEVTSPWKEVTPDKEGTFAKERWNT